MGAGAAIEQTHYHNGRPGIIPPVPIVVVSQRTFSCIIQPHKR